MQTIYRYKPFKYFFLTMLITWVAGFAAAYFSYDETLLPYKNIFILISLFTPFTVAMFMIFGSKNALLKKDFKKRLFSLKLIRPRYWLAILLIMPVTLLLATAISLFFGRSIAQFSLSPELTFFGGEALIILIILVLAPTFEELGWRGYGIDGMKKGRSMIGVTFIYALLWLSWHIPLFFINGYYQNELLHENILYALNFVISLFPAAFLMNWIYYKNNRSIIAMIMFHVVLNLFSILLQTEQFTKCIITFILIIVSGYVLSADKEFFFKKNEKQ